MKPKPQRSSIYLCPGQSQRLQAIAARFGLYHTRGVGTGTVGSISQLIQAIAEGEGISRWTPEEAGIRGMQMDKIKVPIKAALAALSQPKTHQADIDYAKRLLADALTEIAAQEAAEEEEA